MGIPLRLLLIGALLLAGSCAPLTYSEQGAVDFETYRSVRVSVTSTSFTGGSEYLAHELEELSGFETVTLDPAVPVDAVLGVSLSVIFAPTVDAEGNSVDQYEATTDYALTAGTTRVDSGHTTGAASNANDAAESALDGVTMHYVAPYRL
jgi:hypothetical protein